MTKLTRYISFKELKAVNEPNKTTATEQRPYLSEFESLLARLRNEFLHQRNEKRAHGK